MYYPKHCRREYRRRRHMAVWLQQMAAGALGGLLIALLMGAPFFLP